MSQPEKQRPNLADSPTLRWLVRAAVERPRLTLALWGVAAAFATLGVLRAEFETTAGSMLNKSDASWAFYQESQDRFGGDSVIVLALEGSTPFASETLRRIDELTQVAEGIPEVRRVDSVTSFPIVQGSPDGTLVLDPAVDGRTPPEEIDPRLLREVLARDRIAERILNSTDGRVLAVNVFLEKDAGPRQAEIVGALEAELGDAGWISGVPIYETHAGSRTQQELALFVPLTVLLIGGILYGAFRSASAVVIPLLTGGLGTWLLVALMGALDEPVTFLAMLLPSVMLALGCAYVMHVLVAARGIDEMDRLVSAIQQVATPIALSGLTTAIGFFAISIIPIHAIRALGAFGGVGVLIVLLGSLTAAPAALRIWPLRGRGSAATTWLETRGAERLAHFNERRRKAVLTIWTVLLGATMLGLVRVEIETDATLWWPHGTPIRDGYESIRERLSGISPVNVVIEARGERTTIEPEVLARIDALAAYLEGLPEVGRAISVADPLRQLHGGFSDDSGDPLPDSRELAAQYLLLLESVDHVHDIVSTDRRSANIALRVDHNGSKHLLAVAEEATSWWAREGLPDFTARATGIMFEFARSEDEVAWGVIRGLTLAFLAVALILLAVFRELRVAWIVMVPNLVPLLVIYGLMGWLRIPIDAGTACLGSLALGIAVDDSIHVAASCVGASRSHGWSVRTVALGLSRVLPAIVMTTLAIFAGFAVIGLSEFTLTRNLGLITALLVVLCLAADATLLPLLLLGRGARRDEGAHGERKPGEAAAVSSLP